MPVNVAAILLVSFVFVFFVSTTFIIKRYKRCPSDKILVIYGKIGKKDGKSRSAKCYHGGAAFIIPVFQNHSDIDRHPMPPFHFRLVTPHLEAPPSECEHLTGPRHELFFHSTFVH